MQLFVAKKSTLLVSALVPLLLLTVTSAALAQQQQQKKGLAIVSDNGYNDNDRFRKLLVRYEKKSKNYLGLVQLACCMILYRKIFLG